MNAEIVRPLELLTNADTAALVSRAVYKGMLT